MMGVGILRRQRRGGGLIVPTAEPVEAAAWGDSYAGFHGNPVPSGRYDWRGPMHWANALLGGPMRIRPAAMLGVTGETAAQILARFATLNGLSPKPKLVYLSAGNNDANTGVATATTLANYDSMISQATAQGMVLVCHDIFARDTYTPEQIAATKALNTGLRQRAAANQLVFADCSMLVQDSGLMIPGISYDGIHLNTRGARLVGERMRHAIARYCSGGFPMATVASPGLFPNGLLAGTGGTMNLGFTGQNADGWSFFHNTSPSGGTRVASKRAHPDGHGEQIQIAFSGVTLAGQYSGGPTRSVDYATSTIAENDWFEVAVEVEVLAGAVNLQGVAISVLDNNGASTNNGHWTFFAGQVVDTWATDERFVFRTYPLQRRADAGTDSITIRMQIVGDGTGAGITATVRFGRVTLRKFA